VPFSGGRASDADYESSTDGSETDGNS
jgi:hypothetical protein